MTNNLAASLYNAVRKGKMNVAYMTKEQKLAVLAEAEQRKNDAEQIIEITKALLSS